MPLRPLIDSSRTRLRTWIAQHDAVADRALADNITRVRWAALLIIPLNLLYAGIFWLGPLGATAAEQDWKRALGWSHLAMALTLTLLALWAQWARRQPPTLWTRVLVIVMVCCALGFMVALVTIDQLVTPSITPFVIGSSLTGVLILLRPGIALPLYCCAYAAFFVAIGTTQHDANQLLSNRINGFSAAALGLLLSVMLWRKNTVSELLRSDNERNYKALQDKQQQLEYLASHDALTGLYNRHEFNRQADMEVARALRYQTAVCVIVTDVDFFKAVNDVHGHPAGDQVLKHMADLLRATVRTTDVVARMGGEEFIILLPHTTLTAATALAEKLRAQVEATSATVGEQRVNLRASFGVASLAQRGTETFAALYARADQALYAAKHLGRNRVEVASEVDASPD